MVVSSRTPEGQPQLCPICGALVTTTPDTPFGDSTCSRCGALLAQLSDSLQARLRQWIEQLGPDGFITRDGGLDSLDTVELVIELEEELNLDIPDDEAERIQTPADLIRLVLKYIHPPDS